MKSAYLQETFYIGDDQLDTLANIKSREEMIGEIIGLLQSPIRNLISALQNKPEVAEAKAEAPVAEEPKQEKPASEEGAE